MNAAPGVAARVYGALIAQTLISAGTYLAAKRALTELTPFNLVLTRILLSAAIFAILLLVTPGLVLPPRRAVPMFLLLGLLCGPLNQGLFFYGLSRSKPAHAALLYALTPIGVYVLTLAVRREHASRLRAFGIAIAFCGVVVLLLGRGLEAASGPLIGDLFILGAVAAWVVYTTEGKRCAAEHGPIRTTAWSMIFAALWSLPLAPFWLEPARLWASSPVALGCIAYLVLLTSVLSYLFWYYALSRTDASRVVVFANLQPVATAVAAWALLGDALVWEIWVGGALVLIGVRLTHSLVAGRFS